MGSAFLCIINFYLVLNVSFTKLLNKIRRQKAMLERNNKIILFAKTFKVKQIN